MSSFEESRAVLSRWIAPTMMALIVMALSAGFLFAQSSSPTTSGTAGSAGKPWKDYPRGVAVTRWPEESTIRPITFAAWKEKQPAAEPLRASLVNSFILVDNAS